MNNELTLRINGTRKDMERAERKLEAQGYKVLDSWCVVMGAEYVIAYRAS